jgi:hypothetical protein
MKSVILNFLFVLIYNLPLIKLASNIPGTEKKNFRNSMKSNNENSSSIQTNHSEPLNVFDVQTEDIDNTERFNFDNIILNLSTIENKIKSFKNKLESKF